MAAVPACGPEGGAPTTGAVAEVRDSAGVRIMTLRSTAIPRPVLRLDPEPVVRIVPEGPGGEWRLHRIAALDVAPDGDLLVANAGEGLVLRFDRAGSLVASAGGEGRGPGEFTSLMDLAVAGDDALALDFLPRKVVRFDRAGARVREFTLDREGGRPLEIWWTGEGVLGAGFHLPGELSPSESLSSVRRTARYVLYDASGRVIRTVATGPGPEMFMRTTSAGDEIRTASVAPLVQHTARHAVVGDELVIGYTGRWELRVVSLDGELVSLVRAPGLERPLDDARWGARRDARARRIRADLGEEAGPALQVLDELAEAPRPRILPAFGRLVAGDTGKLWIGPERVPEGGSPRWMILDLTTGGVETLDLPPRFTLRAVRGDVVVGVERDAHDVETVVGRRVVRGPG